MIVFVTDRNPQSQLFKEYVARQISYTVTIRDPSEIESTDSDADLILFDADYVDKNTAQMWGEGFSGRESLKFGVLNIYDEDHAVDVLTTLHVDGVFYRHDNIGLVCKGVKALLDGERWMPRPLMSRLIDFYRRQQTNAFRPTCGLTHRELEILAQLMHGASNPEMADLMFVSEHTIKSHLYNIFRKIKVNSRRQAISWAFEHLGPPPPQHKRMGSK